MLLAFLISLEEACAHTHTHTHTHTDPNALPLPIAELLLAFLSSLEEAVIQPVQLCVKPPDVGTRITLTLEHIAPVNPVGAGIMQVCEAKPYCHEARLYYQQSEKEKKGVGCT